MILLFDLPSLHKMMSPPLDTKLVNLIALRMSYKLKMVHYPDTIVVFNTEDNRGAFFQDCHYTTNVLNSIKRAGISFDDAVIMSANPEVLALNNYGATSYRPSEDWLDPQEVTANRVKLDLGYDPRDVSFFAKQKIVEPSKAAKMKAGQTRKKRWDWAENPMEGEIKLKSIADNIHVKVGRESFSNYEVIQDLPDFLTKLSKVDIVGWDTETNGLSWQNNHIVGESFSFDGKHGYYLPVSHNTEGEYKNVPWGEVKDKLHPMLAKKTLVGANLSFDVLMPAEHGLGFPTNLLDVQGFAYMLGMHVPQPNKLGLKALSADILGDVMEEFGAVTKGDTFDNIAIDRGAPYAADDAVKSFRLGQVLGKRLTEEQHKRYTEIEMPFLSACIRMSYNGMFLNMEKLSPLLHELEGRAELLNSRIQMYNGEEMNVNSPVQLGKLLFKKLGLPTTARTKTGYSTSKAELERIENTHEVVGIILEYRELAKLINTYLKGYPDHIGTDNRIHSRLNPFRVITGRLASTEPNLMNIPIRTDNGKSIRRLFEGEGEHVLLSADAAQLEYRILAHYSKNRTLVDAFSDETRDVHKEMASLIFEVPVSEITGDQRSAAKNIVYAVIYGASPIKISMMLNRPVDYAANVLDKIASNIPEIERLRTAVITDARKYGYVESLGGHRSYIHGINSYNSSERGAAERSAFDSLFQGTASGDITKIATNKVQELLDKVYPDKFNPGIKLVQQIHDEVLLEGDEQELKSIAPEVLAAFEDAMSLDVPLVAEYSIGKNWGDIH